MDAQNRPQSKSLEAQSGPWLVFFCTSRKGKANQIFYSLSERRSYVKNICQNRDSICVPTPQGWMLRMNWYDEYCYLQDPVAATKIKLPPLTSDFKDAFVCSLSSSPTDPSCRVLVASLKKHRLFFCRPGDEQWIQHEYDLGDNPLTDILALEGKFYGLTLKKSFAMIDSSPYPSINIFETINSNWPVGVDRGSWCLVESCGPRCFYLSVFMKHVTQIKLHIFLS